MSQPNRYDIRLTAGDDYEIVITLKFEGDPIDTQGFTFRAQARAGHLPHAPLIEEFAVTPEAGGARLKLSAEQTRTLGQAPRVVWDFQSSSPEVRTWLAGRVLVTPEVTQ